MRPDRAAAFRTDVSPTLSPVPLTDEDLVAQTLKGRPGAFEDLVRRHQHGIFAFLFRMARDPDDAADLAQEVFLKVFANLEQYKPEFRFKTWLYRIAANAAVDRRRRRRPTRSINELGPENEDGASTIPSIDPGPEEALHEREMRDRIEAALEEMPASHREVLLLRFQGDMRYDEIAAITRLPLGTVKNRIFRAREFLKKAIS